MPVLPRGHLGISVRRCQLLLHGLAITKSQGLVFLTVEAPWILAWLQVILA